MILSDRDIRARLTRGDLKIAPIEDEELQIQPASVDLRLGSRFLLFRSFESRQNVSEHASHIDPRDKDDLQHLMNAATVEEGGYFMLHPLQFVLASTIERVTVPHDIVARLEGRSSLGRLGLVVHATAGYIDPGFEGTITLELSNICIHPIKLYPGMRIAQLSLHELSSAAERPYGAARGSKYGGQDGPEASRIALDQRGSDLSLRARGESDLQGVAIETLYSEPLTCPDCGLEQPVGGRGHRLGCPRTLKWPPMPDDEEESVDSGNRTRTPEGDRF